MTTTNIFLLTLILITNTVWAINLIVWLVYSFQHAFVRYNITKTFLYLVRVSTAFSFSGLIAYSAHVLINYEYDYKRLLLSCSMAVLTSCITYFHYRHLKVMRKQNTRSYR